MENQEKAPSQKKSTDISFFIIKAIPFVGALLLAAGLGYLIYTNIWTHVQPIVRIILGFFTSFLIIGTAWGMQKKLRDFSDYILGIGILLFYGTLMYGSRALESSQAIIPEIATLFTALVFMSVIGYIATIRQSKIILSTSILGAYLTPFFIYQNENWAINLSYNSYIIYFCAVSISTSFFAKKIFSYEIILTNTLGLFASIFSLAIIAPYRTYPSLAEISAISQPSFWQGYIVTIILLTLIVVLSITSIVHSSRIFHEKFNDSKLAAAYLVPLIWFLIQISLLESQTPTVTITSSLEVLTTVATKILSYLAIAASYFYSWYYLRPLEYSKYQHIAAYSGGTIATTFAISNIFGTEMNAESAMFIAFLWLFFALWNFQDSKKWERILSAIFLTLVWGVFGILLPEYLLPWISSLLAPIPMILLLPIVLLQKNTPRAIQKYLIWHSIFGIILFLLNFNNFFDFFWLFFSEEWFFIFVGFLMILITFLIYSPKKYPGLALLWLIPLTIGFFPTFFTLFANIVPDTLNHTSITDEFPHILNGIFAALSYFLLIKILQRNTEKSHNTGMIFLITSIFYITILLIVNTLIILICNELWYEYTIGGIRAVGTTLWWIIFSLFLLIMGIKNQKKHSIEKVFGALLFLLTIIKILLYDLGNMDMDKKIIVLMITGGILLLFSYFGYKNNYFTEAEKSSVPAPNTPDKILSPSEIAENNETKNETKNV